MALLLHRLPNCGPFRLDLTHYSFSLNIEDAALLHVLAKNECFIMAEIVCFVCKVVPNPLQKKGLINITCCLGYKKCLSLL